MYANGSKTTSRWLCEYINWYEDTYNSIGEWNILQRLPVSRCSWFTSSWRDAYPLHSTGAIKPIRIKFTLLFSWNNPLLSITQSGDIGQLSTLRFIMSSAAPTKLISGKLMHSSRWISTCNTWYGLSSFFSTKRIDANNLRQHLMSTREKGLRIRLWLVRLNEAWTSSLLSRWTQWD